MNEKTSFVLIAVGVAILLIVVLVMLRRKTDVALLLMDGRVYTVTETQPLAEAVAIDNGVIRAVGTTKDLESRYRAQRTIDLHGQAVFPGFIDSHAHLEELGVALQNLDLAGTASVEEVQHRIAAEVAKRPPGSWIRGRGWDQNRWKKEAFPTRATLDAVSPNNPVFLTRIDGHAVWVNSKALERAHISLSTQDPEGGKIIRDREGEPTGVFIDHAIDLLIAVLPQPDEQERISSINRAVHECLRFGLTEVHDMGVDSGGIELYKRLINEKKFPFRVYAAMESVKALWDQYRASGPVVDGYDGRLTLRAIKLYADGALGSRGAALIEPYSDDPGNRGLTLTAEKELKTVVQQAYDAGFQVCIHAIGDRANAIVLNVYAEVLDHHDRDVRFRIEHAQVLAPGDIPRFHALGVLPMMQPTHCTSDMPWAEERLGPKRILGAYAWHSLLATGSIVPAGSDFPVESPNPILGFYAAITRQDAKGFPEGGWHPEQRMTREEALKAYTIWGAYAGFQERHLGTIEEGKWADLVVLTDDIMKVSPDRILSASVAMTIVAGEIVYTAQGGVENLASNEPAGPH